MGWRIETASSNPCYDNVHHSNHNWVQGYEDIRPPMHMPLMHMPLMPMQGRHAANAANATNAANAPNPRPPCKTNAYARPPCNQCSQCTQSKTANANARPPMQGRQCKAANTRPPCNQCISACFRGDGVGARLVLVLFWTAMAEVKNFWEKVLCIWES